jgi:hypothetical protein
MPSGVRDRILSLPGQPLVTRRPIRRGRSLRTVRGVFISLRLRCENSRRLEYTAASTRTAKGVIALNYRQRYRLYYFDNCLLYRDISPGARDRPRPLSGWSINVVCPDRCGRGVRILCGSRGLLRPRPYFHCTQEWAASISQRVICNDIASFEEVGITTARCARACKQNKRPSLEGRCEKSVAHSPLVTGYKVKSR